MIIRLMVDKECWAGKAGPRWKAQVQLGQWWHCLSLLPRSSYTKASPIYPFLKLLNYWMHALPRLFVLVHPSGTATTTAVVLCIKAAWNRKERKFAQFAKGLSPGYLNEIPIWFWFKEMGGEAGDRGRCLSLGTLSPSHPRHVLPCQRHNSLQYALLSHLPHFPAQEIVEASHRESWIYQAIVPVLGKAIR